MNIKHTASLALILTFILVTPLRSQERRSPKRVALVIGNMTYKVGPLTNPKNDALAITKALQAIDFKVTTRFDRNKFEIEEDIDIITKNLNKGDALLIFYSGHGIQLENTNYLVPVGITINREFHVRQRCVNADYMLSAMEDSRASLRIMILDACRDNPFPSFIRTAKPGLATLNAPDGTIIVYSTGPGQVAQDGYGKNSPFTKHLVKTLASHPPQGLEVNDMFGTVARALKKETGQRAHVTNDASMEQYFLKPAILPDIRKKPPGTIELKPLSSYRNLDISLVRKHAEYGFADAQAQLGDMYDQGIQTNQNYYAAMKWHRKAIEGGSARAMNNLGVCYEHGHGVRKNFETALKYYRLSAANGYPMAKRNLGVSYRRIYNDGQGLERDGQLAVEWFEEAAVAPPHFPGRSDRFIGPKRSR